MKRHASETTLGHLQRHHTRRGPVLRLHRRPSGLIVQQAAPLRIDPMREVAEILAGVVVLGAFIVGALLWIAIGQAAAA